MITLVLSTFILSFLRGMGGNTIYFILFYSHDDCVEVLRPSQPNGVMLSAVSLPNHTFTGQASSSQQLTSIVHIHSPETDNCPS